MIEWDTWEPAAPKPTTCPVADAVTAEREACAQVADRLFVEDRYTDAAEVADAIRARGEEDTDATDRG